MMKLLLAVALAVIAVCNVKAACPEITGCTSCTNYGVLCHECSMFTVLSQDRTSCLDCSDRCVECESDADDVVTCIECLPGNYLKDGECIECADGCEECHEDDTGTVHCDACYENSYVQDTASATGECIACDSNCKKCSLNADLTTTCSECYSYAGLGARGYYLKAEDKSCKSCPTNCEKCKDDGNGVGICQDCFDNYMILVDEEDSTKSGTKCVKCPTECSACTGVEFSTGIATCTACKPELGNYVDGGECISCDDNCLTCTDEGECAEEGCAVGYREDSGACVACPAFCDSCAVDETTSEDVCVECESQYGTKVYDTCDACTTPNCKTCTRASDGTMSCSTCKDGYGPGSDGKCTACATGCLACTYSTNHMKCTSCKDGYSDSVYPAVSSSTDPSLCLKCPSTCSECDSDTLGDVDCTVCADEDTHYVDDTQTPVRCSAMPSNCDTASSGTCDDCLDGYYNNSNTCDACPAALNCKTCNYDGSRCTSCASGSGMVDTDMDNETETCEACGISNCDRCFARGGYQGQPKQCWQCKTGYSIYDTETESTAFGTKCKSCPTGCTTCTVDYNDNDKTKCTSGGCTVWDGKKAYTDGESGTCVVCPDNCEVCSYDSSTETTTCDDNECTDVYAKTADGLCEACSDNCLVCELDSSTEAIKCSDDSCDVGYGNDADGGCSACPNNCDACSLSGETDDTVLHCDTCSDGHVLNNDVCGACSSNCVECADEFGSMICSACKDEYALDSSKACVKCPTNCAECSATKCTACKSGYGLSVDGLTCVACGEAAMENCGLCGNINSDSGRADCLACSSGYALEDMAANKSCVDAGQLSCGSGSYIDAAAQCDVCEDGFQLTENLLCAIMCYACGDVEAGVYVDSASCTIPTGGANATASDTDAELIPCTNGVCYGASSNGQVMGGCMPSTMAECSVDANNGETCQSAFEDERCERCCSVTECNTWLPELDGVPDSATSVAINMLLMSLTAVVISLFNL